MDTATSNTGGGSAFASDSSTNLATVIKGLKKFDGKDPAEFKTWMKKFCVVLGVTRKDILPLLKKQRKPDPADTAAFDSYTRANEDLYAILFLLVELPAALSIQKHEDDTGISGDGQAAFEELCNNYDRVTDEVIRAKMEELENNPMNPGENPDDYFNQKHLLRTQLDKMGEPISDRRFKHICVQGFSDEYKDVKLMVFRDPTFNVLDMQSTMRNIFLDEQSRKGWKGRIAGRGFAMATTASDIICHGCYEPGHIRRNCPKIKNRAKKKTKPAGATKWCSKHNTTSHSDEECYQQGGKRPGDTKDSSKAFTACSNCTHCSSASNKHDSNNEVAVVDFTRDEDAFDSGFMFATCSRISGRNFAASSTGVGLLVDTGASETMFDNRLIPDGNLHDYTQRNSPKIVDVAGESQLKGTATGILHCTVKDNRGQRLRVRIQGLIVPGLGRNIFSPTSLLKKGLRCVVEENTPHLTIQGKVIPLTQDPRDQGMCTLDITFEQNVQPSGTKSLVPHQKQSQTHTANAVCFTLVSADTWHRRLGHLNARSLNILRKDTGTGVDYRDSLSPCGVCQIAKHKQSPHPKQSTRELSRPGQLVVIDNMGPVNPPAKYKGGSFPYACKITDDYTKMKEVYLLRKKSDTTEAVHTYNMCVAAAGGYRIETIRCDKGGENTGSEFRDYCKNSAIKLEYAATNTPQQIGVSERDGQTLAGVTRCLLKDGDFPPSMWGELMLTAAYLLNRSPHSALGGATPYSKLHNKSPDLSGLRVIGARAFVHHERYRKKLDDRAFEGKLCGFGLDSQTYRILNPSNGAVVESRNVTFIESPPRSVPFQYSTEANGYESDVLSFTSLLDSPHSTSDLDFMAQNELLRQEVRKMQQDNLAREEIRLELDGHEDEHGNGQDLGDGDAPSPQQLAHLPTGRCRCLPERPLRQRCVRQTRPRYIRQELRDGRTHGVQTRTEPLRPIAVACALERHPERIPHGVRMEKDSIRPLRVRVYQRQHHRDSHGLRRRHSHHGRRPAARGPEEEGAHGSIRDDRHGRGKADPRDRRAAGLRARNPGHFTGALREHTSGAVRNARGQPSEHSWIRSGNLHESTSGPNPRIHGQENLPVDDGKHPLPGPVHAIRPLLRCPTTFQGLQQPGAGEHDSSQARSSIPSG